MATKIAVLSDTHGLLRPEVLDRIAGCDVIIHGGDINKPEIIDRLKEIAPVYVVRGNNDKEWAENIPESLTFQIEKSRFFVVHNKKFVAKDLYDADVVIYGHSHKYAEQMVDGVLWLNPGSCGKRRFDQEITFAIMTVDGSNTEIEKITIPHTFSIMFITLFIILLILNQLINVNILFFQKIRDMLHGMNLIRRIYILCLRTLLFRSAQ